jgi:hypothetical protein
MSSDLARAPSEAVAGPDEQVAEREEGQNGGDEYDVEHHG